MDERIGKIEVPLARAAAPKSLRVLDSDAAVLEIVERIPMRNAFVDEGARRFATRCSMLPEWI